MFVVKKRTVVIVATLLVTAITFIACFGALYSGGAVGSGVGNGDVRIVLDAGHGGKDGGVSGISSGIKESTLNLDVVKRIERHLVASGFSVTLTRSSDAGLYGVATSNLKKRDMLKRKEIITEAKPTLVVSVHMNAYALSSRCGAQVFYKAGSEEGKLLASLVQKSFNSMEKKTRECNALSGDYYILNCSEYPSIIAECGFLSNPEEEKLLLTEEYREDLAYAIFKGIINYLTETTGAFWTEGVI